MEIKGDFDRVVNFVVWKFPAGAAGNVVAQRIQTAAKGVNGFVKEMRRKTDSQTECETEDDLHSARRDGRQIG